jgi:hypothetical protein
MATSQTAFYVCQRLGNDYTSLEFLDYITTYYYFGPAYLYLIKLSKLKLKKNRFFGLFTVVVIMSDKLWKIENTYQIKVLIVIIMESNKQLNVIKTLFLNVSEIFFPKYNKNDV